MASETNSNVIQAGDFENAEGTDTSGDLISNNEEDEDDDTDDEDDARSSHFLFQDFLAAITRRIKTARQTQLTTSIPQSKAEHNAYWRAFYQHLRQDAAAGRLERPLPSTQSSITTEVRPLLQTGACFDPPCKRLGIVFGTRADAGSCPCCISSGGYPDYVVYSSDWTSRTSAQPERSFQGATRQGVTFDMLLAGICESLYGTADDNGASAVCGTLENDKPVFHSCDYMIFEKGLSDGNIYIYVDDVNTGLESIDAANARRH